MKRKFEMIEKGYEYATDGYQIRLDYQKKALTNTGHSTLDRHGWVRGWTVYSNDEPRAWRFHTLKEAKNFIIEREGE